MNDSRIEYLRKITRSIPDFPKKGILFRDITTIIQDRTGMQYAVETLSELLDPSPVFDPGSIKLIGIEARGFLFAGALSGKLGGGIVLARKPGKLPYRARKKTYNLEYGHETIEIHEDAIGMGENVVVVDDLLATGGTARATCELVEELGGIVKKVIFLIELTDLGGREQLSKYDVQSVFSFEGE